MADNQTSGDPFGDHVALMDQITGSGEQKKSNEEAVPA